MSQRLPSQRLVRVKFVPATDTRGARYACKAFGRSVTISADYVISPARNAELALLKVLHGLPVEDVKTLNDAHGFSYLVTLAKSYRLTFTVEA
jgi:hypothetical protein